MASAEQMQVQMMHGLPSIVPGVDDDAVPLLEFERASEVGCRRHEVA